MMRILNGSHTHWIPAFAGMTAQKSPWVSDRIDDQTGKFVIVQGLRFSPRRGGSKTRPQQEDFRQKLIHALRRLRKFGLFESGESLVEIG